MKKILDQIAEKLADAFAEAGYGEAPAKVTLSNRPDLCDYQCNGALAAAKQYKKAPMVIAEEVIAALGDCGMFSEVSAAKPGFINMRLSGPYLSGELNEMAADPAAGIEPDPESVIMIDFGGANIAKPLHVGHLRSAIIGESLKRIFRAKGQKVIGDAHLGDWGLQMGLIIAEMSERQPELPYFDPAFEGPYPEEAPFTIGELEEIYPTANAKSKEDEAFREKAKQATFELQQGRAGYRALWNHIKEVSLADLKKNYGRLKVEFDLWKAESDAQPYIPDMVRELKDSGHAYISEGALVVDVKEETDQKEIPPCMILKSDNATLYSTTDLATLVERRKLFDPDRIIYVVDKRQGMHFEQVFRCAKKTGIVRPETQLDFLGFGTMNGKDGKPFKTRDGGVLRLEVLLNDVSEAVSERMHAQGDRGLSDEEIGDTARMIALAAIKYGDLSNQATKDYIFDIDRFTSFEGNTGPYILYTIVRIGSILKKYYAADDGSCSLTSAELFAGKVPEGYVSEGILPAVGESERDLQLKLAEYPLFVEAAVQDLAPHKICQYVYELSDTFNSFYHETRILAEEDAARKSSYIALITLTGKVLSECIGLLGFEAPERM
ncbi:MAG: arginine--tRNA ligase [Lachnospiraceae bacterium]|nr:arginine--tRNA ligase [Lachnospiraceae bacterium]